MQNLYTSAYIDIHKPRHKTTHTQRMQKDKNIINLCNKQQHTKHVNTTYTHAYTIFAHTRHILKHTYVYIKKDNAYFQTYIKT